MDEEENVKAPRTNRGSIWERTIARWFTVNGIPVKWETHKGQFTGIAAHSIRRIVPQSSASNPDHRWARIPEIFTKYKDDPGLILVFTNSRYGSGIEDSYVVTRLETFTPMFAALVTNDKERYIRASTDHG